MGDAVDPFEEDLEVMRNFFSRQLQDHCEGPAAVGWGSTYSQATRFRVLFEIGDLTGATILDVGCGRGDFYAFLMQKKVCFSRYLGLDIHETVIERARERFPSAEFRVLGSLLEPISDLFDYVFESGIFNLATPEALKLTKATLRWMYQLSIRGTAANFLSLFSPFSLDPRSQYYNPADMLDFVHAELSHCTVLRHDYKSNDFTLYMYRECSK